MKSNNKTLVMVLLLMVAPISLFIASTSWAEETQLSSDGLEAADRKILRDEYKKKVFQVRREYRLKNANNGVDTRSTNRGLRDDNAVKKADKRADLYDEKVERMKGVTTLKEKRVINKDIQHRRDDFVSKTNKKTTLDMVKVREKARAERVKLEAERDKKLEALHSEYTAEIERRQRLKHGDKAFEDEMSGRTRIN